MPSNATVHALESLIAALQQPGDINSAHAAQVATIAAEALRHATRQRRVSSLGFCVVAISGITAYPDDPPIAHL